MQNYKNKLIRLILLNNYSLILQANVTNSIQIMKKLLSMLLIFAAILSVGTVVSSCGGDDDDDQPSMSFDRQSIFGT